MAGRMVQKKGKGRGKGSKSKGRGKVLLVFTSLRRNVIRKKRFNLPRAFLFSLINNLVLTVHHFHFCVF